MSIKTPNPKCHLYWCFIEFIDWRYSHSCWYFWPLLWTSAPLAFGDRGGPQTDKHLPPSTFTDQFLRKADIKGLVSLNISGPWLAFNKILHSECGIHKYSYLQPMWPTVFYHGIELFNTASSVVPQILLCRRLPGLKPNCIDGVRCFTYSAGS